MSNIRNEYWPQIISLLIFALSPNIAFSETETRIFLESEENYIVTTDVHIYGSGGSETVTVQGTPNLVLDGNVEKVVLPGNKLEYVILETGTQLSISDSKITGRSITVLGLNDQLIVEFDDTVTTISLVGLGQFSYQDTIKPTAFDIQQFQWSGAGSIEYSSCEELDSLQSITVNSDALEGMFINNSETNLSLKWKNFDNQLVDYGNINPLGGSLSAKTYQGHIWVIQDSTERCLGVISLKNDDPVEVSTPPFWGTIFIDPDIITEQDPSAFVSATYSGTGSRQMFDRRENNWVVLNAFLFNVIFSDGLTTEVQVNPEFSTVDDARIEAEKYARLIGQLPTTLRNHVDTVWIHKGTEAFGGGNRNILIHTGQAALYEADGIIEETLFHEGTHTSIDEAHASHSDWIQAQNSDPTYISQYAQDNPTREDLAESLLTHFAVRYRSDRISSTLYNQITSTIPNRLNYFDSIGFITFPQ